MQGHRNVVNRKVSIKSGPDSIPELSRSSVVHAVAETGDRDSDHVPLEPLYLEALTLVEWLHRRLLDFIKDEFDRRGRAEINSVQALLLYNIGDEEAAEFRTRASSLRSTPGQ
jgi:hypothetical protein